MTGNFIWLLFFFGEELWDNFTFYSTNAIKTGLNFKRIHCTSSQVLDISFVSRPFLRIGDWLLTVVWHLPGHVVL